MRRAQPSTWLAGAAAAAIALTACASPDAVPAAHPPPPSPEVVTATATATATVTVTAAPDGEESTSDAATSASPTSVASPSSNGSAGEGRLAAGVLAQLPVKGRAPKTGYDRAMFGQRWADTDRNGCDTRNDILGRDLTGVTFKPGTRGCVVLSGTLAPDPFTGATIGFVRGNDTSNAVQIDHVVALSDAWQKGAQQLDEGTRTLFANDPLNLLAVDGPANAQKGDGDAATWLPPNKPFRCEYVALQVAVKHRYRLWLTQPEHDAIARVLESCPGQRLPGDASRSPSPAPPSAVPTSAAPAPAKSIPAKVVAPSVTARPPTAAPDAPAPVTEAPAPVQAVAPPPVEDVHYKNCTAARDAGAAPVLAGQPGYGKHLDRDGDGIGCE
ncbi:GmrSD restriction endonuclease domain-containing protein [Tessaracoccus oleiagri]|uniref:Excalibur calcium-binding domain-containing protein n=1 Tax=Tessaracoccus oleiagri TaxID=686624 RepID=A0A1G9MI01_9ACTN|nr:Excalibur calcium-binding domain-containing protein [Tessaracoccus oleiagri]